MTNAKVAVPREVAEAIDHLRTITYSNHEIMRLALNVFGNPKACVVHGWAFGSNGGGTPDLLMQALVNGYEIEKSPEDRVREYYERQIVKMPGYFNYEHAASRLRRSTVIETLDMLGIKIEGVNA